MKPVQVIVIIILLIFIVVLSYLVYKKYTKKDDNNSSSSTTTPPSSSNSVTTPPSTTTKPVITTPPPTSQPITYNNLQGSDFDNYDIACITNTNNDDTKSLCDKSDMCTCYMYNLTVYGLLLVVKKLIKILD